MDNMKEKFLMGLAFLVYFMISLIVLLPVLGLLFHLNFLIAIFLSLLIAGFVVYQGNQRMKVLSQWLDRNL